MSYFMIEISLPETLTPDFMELIPLQRRFIDKMMKKGVIMSYSLSFDRSRLWIIVLSNSINEVKNLVGSFPIFCFIKFRINNLLFHEVNNQVPQFWLN
jgi:hypothetical protein